MSDTPKYIGILNTENDGDFLISETHDKEHPTREELDAFLNAERIRFAEVGDYGTITPELYIRERDTRRQFSPEQLVAIHDKLLANVELHITTAQRFAKQVDIVLEEYRKLIHES